MTSDGITSATAAIRGSSIRRSRLVIGATRASIAELDHVTAPGIEVPAAAGRHHKVAINACSHVQVGKVVLGQGAGLPLLACPAFGPANVQIAFTVTGGAPIPMLLPDDPHRTLTNVRNAGN